MGFIHDFDLTQAWIEIERFYDYLRTTFITFFRCNYFSLEFDSF